LADYERYAARGCVARVYSLAELNARSVGSSSGSMRKSPSRRISDDMGRRHPPADAAMPVCCWPVKSN